MPSVAENKLNKIKEDAVFNMQRVLVLPDDPTTYELLSTRVCKDGSKLYNIKMVSTS